MNRPTDRSAQLFQRAVGAMPGGVNSPVRAFGSVGGTPRFLQRGAGSHIWDVDGNEYIDYVCSWGPLILGHAPQAVVEAACQATRRGSSFGAPTEIEVQMAELVKQCFPGIELLRMVSSGTEAAMSATRVARAYTGRSKVLKFDGCWHGHVDALLVRAGSTGLQYGVPDSAGVPQGCASDTLVARYNDLDSVRQVLAGSADDCAAIIVEPVAGNMGVIPPRPGFLQGLRDLCTQHGILLIFDEVITGFRLALGGAQERYGVRADLTTLGKIIGGGFPAAAYGGSAEIMHQVSPLGPMVQAGTLSGNPVALAAGVTTLRALQQPGVYELLEERAAQLEAGLSEAAQRAGVPVRCNRAGSMMTLFFTEHPVTDADDLAHCSSERYAAFFHGMLDRGIAFAPSYCEAAFVSTAHTPEDIEQTVAAAREVLAQL